jgi:hypothetical protein
MQSADVLVEEETVSFHDEKAGEDAGFTAKMDAVVSNDAADSTDLARFLARPVRIANFTWNEADAAGTRHTYNPWRLFFDDTRIKKKLDNFAFLQCDLRIKVIINASPFYYGAMIAAYQPLQNLTPTTFDYDGSFKYRILQSQRPHIWLYPQDNTAGDMTLPYFNFRNWIRAQVAQDFTDMGELVFDNYTTLASANGAVGTGVSVTVYAWAENVRVSGPTVGLALQSADEYGTGCVSKPASAVARAASYFTDIPVIGPFARATEIGAGAVSTIASMFGFTNVPVIEDTMPFRPSPFPNFSSSDIAYPVEKLTLDPKNELSIDSRIVGLDGADELNISTLCQKESFLVYADWSTADAIDKTIFTSVVTPHMFDRDAATDFALSMTPMSWVSQAFKNWRGDVIFRFKFIATKYHKGRVRISYDPAGTIAGNISNDAISSTVVFTKVVDLAVDTDVEIRVPYQQAIAWQLTGTGIFFNTPYSLSSPGPFIFDPGYHNGTINVRVLNTLTAPIAASTVQMMVFVRGADNLEFANPVEVPRRATTFALQSADELDNCTVGVVKPSDPNRYLVNFGEAIPSFRSLLRRDNLSSVWTEPTTAVAGNQGIIRQRMTKWPPFYGYDPNGLYTATGTLVPGTYQFNFSHNTLYNWLAPAFIGQRGSMIWTFNAENAAGNITQNIKVIRSPTNTGTAINTFTNLAKGTKSVNAKYYFDNTDSLGAGAALMSQLTSAGLTVLCPNMNPYRFQNTRPNNATNPSAVDASDQDNLILEMSSPSDAISWTSDLKVWKYCSIGTDFNLLFFLNVPRMRVLALTPNGV